MKNKDILLDVIGDIDDNLIPELSAKKKNNRIVKWTAIGGGICAAAIIACAIFLPNRSVFKITKNPNTPESDVTQNTQTGPLPPQTENNNAVQLAAAVYPDTPKYPEESDYSDRKERMQKYDEWFKAKKALRDQPADYKDGFDSFFLNSTRTFLSDSGTDNKVYSPLSLFMALSMSAEISDGNTRKQILDVLAQDDIDSLRSHARSIWQANYIDDKISKCILANSLWTNNKRTYNQSTVDFLAENYYASVYSGDPDTDEYNKLLQDWLNEQTDGLLEDYVSNIEMSHGMVLTLASTVNYSANWMHVFSEELTEKDTFHSPTGDIECDFMNAQITASYCWGEKFASVSMPLEYNGEMRLILPDEGLTPEELINDDEVIGYMMNVGEYENSKKVRVNLSVPKFDVSSQMDLKDGLKELGITDAFNSDNSDFSPLTEETEIYIDKVEHDARVIIDENGCKASALTEMMLWGGGGMRPDEQVDFTLDRPFIFEIMSETGLPLFVGIVNNPAQ